LAAEDMNEKRNIDWTAAFALAARAGPRALVRALTTAMETEFAAFTEKYNALFARLRADYDADLVQLRAEYEQRYVALRHELLTMIDDEVTALRRELAAANAELDRLRAREPTH
jgi:hypothetical protein